GAVAVLSAYFLVQAREHALEALDLSARLLEVYLEGLPQIRRARRLRHAWQRLGQLFLGIVGIAQFIEKGVVQCSDLGRDQLLLICRHSLSTSRGAGVMCLH